MEKVFEMHRKRVISTLQAVKQYPNLVVYLDEEFVDGEKVSSTQGIASLQFIQSIGKNQPVKEYEKKYKSRNGESRKGVKLASRATLRGEMRNKGMGSAKWDKLGFVENPYNVIQSEGMLDMDNLDKYEIFYINTSSHLVEGLDEVPVPQAVHFDYMASNGQLENSLYDLEVILEKIKDRSDIHWLGDGVAKVTSIPYYNAERNRDSQLEFKWMPSDEDYHLISQDESFYGLWTKKQSILEKIFGINLESCRRVYTAEELAEEDED